MAQDMGADMREGTEDTEGIRISTVAVIDVGRMATSYFVTGQNVEPYFAYGFSVGKPKGRPFLTISTII